LWQNRFLNNNKVICTLLLLINTYAPLEQVDFSEQLSSFHI
jgi:hypothetical protein